MRVAAHGLVLANTVREVMNPELLLLREDQGASHCLEQLAAFGVSGAPVVDPSGVVVGVVSWKQLVGQSAAVSTVMSQPPATIAPEASVESAAVAVAQSGYHRLVVVDADGRAVGIVSTLDLIRALVGVPASHPPSFPHLDPRTSLTWTDPRPLAPATVGALPEEGGLLVFYRNAVGVPDRVVWAEATDNLAQRLQGILASPADHIPQLRSLLDAGELCFRAAPSADTSGRMKALRSVLYQARDQRRNASAPTEVSRK